MALRHALASLLVLASVLLVVPSFATTISSQPHRSTLLGGSDHDEGRAIAVGPDGALYVAGQTYSTDFPKSPRLDISSNAFVAKLSPDAKTVEWASVFGGRSFDVANAVKVSGTNVFVAGETDSSDFPTAGTNNFDASYGGGTDGFLTVFSASGAMRWSSFLGGSAYDVARDLDADAAGRVIVGGTTLSCDFPTTPIAHRKPPSGCTGFSGDAFVARFGPDGALDKTTLFGGSGNDQLFGVAVNPTTSTVFVTGPTDSTDLATAGSWRTAPDHLYVARLHPNMTSVDYATYLGGSQLEWAWDVVADGSDHAFVTGYTYSSDYPTTSGAYRTTHASPTGCPDGSGTLTAACPDAFVTKIRPDGSSPVWSSLLGGRGDDAGRSVAVDAHGGVHVAGASSSGNEFLPPKSGARGFGDVFHAMLAADGASLTALGAASGSDWDEARGIAISGSLAWTTGFTTSSDYPTSTDAHDRSRGGSTDAFASAFSFPGPTPPNLAFDHVGGNEWWVEVRVTGSPVTAVEARDTGGAWVPLTLRSWGPWAGSFHIEPGHDVQFRGLTQGSWIESCWFSHPQGLERCGEPVEFDASFSSVKGNEWWIETRVDASEPVARVDVRLNGGAPRPLELKSWGSWAASYHAPSGTIVQFTAWNAQGESDASGCYRWTTATPVDCSTPPAQAPVFDHRAGNEWWVEVTVSGPSPDRVEARDTDGPWVALSLRSWGAWANSFHIEPGHDVQFRALTDGAWYESCWFTHAAGQARTGGSTCAGVRVS